LDSFELLDERDKVTKSNKGLGTKTFTVLETKLTPLSQDFASLNKRCLLLCALQVLFFLGLRSCITPGHNPQKLGFRLSALRARRF
jgi:hypothetical protein